MQFFLGTIFGTIVFWILFNVEFRKDYWYNRFKSLESRCIHCSEYDGCEPNSGSGIKVWIGISIIILVSTILWVGGAI